MLGATAVAAAFILPSFLMVLALSALYVRYGGLPWMQSVFYGIGAAVIAIIARSALKLVQADAREGPAAVGAVRRERGGDRLDRVRDRLAVPAAAASWRCSCASPPRFGGAGAAAGAARPSPA